MFASIPYFFQIYCGFSDIRLCKMPCREYCLCHLFFIIFFLSCISFLSDFSSISSDIKLYSFQLVGSVSYWLSGRAGRAGRENTWIDIRTEQNAVWVMTESKIFSLFTRPNSASKGIYHMTIVSSFSSFLLLARRAVRRCMVLLTPSHTLLIREHKNVQSLIGHIITSQTW